MEPEVKQPNWKNWYISLVGFLIAIILFFILFSAQFQ
jgi:hypothetical protein